MKRKKSKLLIGLSTVMLCMAAVPITAFASADEWCEYENYVAPTTVETEEAGNQTTPTKTQTTASKPSSSSTSKSTTETIVSAETVDTFTETDSVEREEAADSGTAFTPTGNLTLVDDISQSGDTTTDKDEKEQFLVVQSRNGNYFYIVIDRSGDEENVHFLNQVDESDLFALVDEEETEDTPVVCTCTDKCAVGNINTACPVCQTTMSECLGKEPEVEEELETKTEIAETSGNRGLLLPLLLVLALLSGGAAYFLKLRKKKPDVKGSAVLDDYDFGDDDEDEDDSDYEFEQDEDESEKENDGD